MAEAAVHEGLFRAVVQDGQIVHGAWLHKRAEGGFVGTCPRCHDYLVPLRPQEIAGRTDYEANCRDQACGYSLCAPGGRVLRTSARASARPKGG